MKKIIFLIVFITIPVISFGEIHNMKPPNQWMIFPTHVSDVYRDKLSYQLCMYDFIADGLEKRKADESINIFGNMLDESNEQLLAKISENIKKLELLWYIYNKDEDNPEGIDQFVKSSYLPFLIANKYKSNSWHHHQIYKKTLPYPANAWFWANVQIFGKKSTKMYIQSLEKINAPCIDELKKALDHK